jgi:endonuclease/exonuclease/phosphatase (EEP) superfamily protein YafD
MKNKLILFCLLIAPLSFASKPLPAAGAGAGLPVLIAGAAASQPQASQVDVKQLQEQQKKDAAKIAQMAAELEALKLELNKDKYVLTWNSKSTGQEEWTETMAIKFGNSTVFERISIYYRLPATQDIKIKNMTLNRTFEVRETKMVSENGITDKQKVHFLNMFINLKATSFCTLLDAMGQEDVLNKILTTEGSCVLE